MNSFFHQGHLIIVVWVPAVLDAAFTFFVMRFHPNSNFWFLFSQARLCLRGCTRTVLSPPLRQISAQRADPTRDRGPCTYFSFRPSFAAYYKQAPCQLRAGDGEALDAMGKTNIFVLFSPPVNVYFVRGIFRISSGFIKTVKSFLSARQFCRDISQRSGQRKRPARPAPLRASGAKNRAHRRSGGPGGQSEIYL